MTPAERLGLVTGWGPTAAALDRAARFVKRLSLPDLADNVASTDQIRAVNRTLAARRPELTRAAARASGAELRGLGFTVDFAPDAEVTTGPADSHLGLPDQTRTLRQLRRADLVPFRAGVDAGLPAVMGLVPHRARSVVRRPACRSRRTATLRARWQPSSTCSPGLRRLPDSCRCRWRGVPLGGC